MATFTERLAIVIDAKTGGVATAFRQTGAAVDDLGQRTDLASRTVQRLGVESVLSGAQLKAGVAVGAAAAGFALASFAKQSIDAASDLEEQVNRTRVVFGDAADGVLDFGENAAESLGLSNRAALQAAGNFGIFFTEIGVGPQKAAELSQGFVRLASDMASFNNIGTDEALEKLRSGLAGETEPLRQVGVFLNEAAVKAKAAELGFGGVGRELTDGEKIMARYALILEKTSKQQNDFERTSGSLANQQRQLQAQVEDLSASLGQALVPSVTALAQAANTVIGPLGELVGLLSKVEAGGVGLTDFLGPLGAVTGPLSVAKAGWDALTGSSDDAADSADDAGDTYKGLGPILRDYRASVDQTAEAERKAAKERREAAQDVESSFFDVLDATESYSDAQEGVSDAERDVARASRDLADARREEAEAHTEAAEAIEDANRSLERSYRSLQQAEESQRRAFFQRQEAAEEAAEAERIYLQHLADFGPNHHLTVEALEEHTDAQQELSEREFDAQEAARSVEDATRGVADAHEELSDAQREAAETSDAVAEATENLSDKQEALRDAQDEAARSAIELEGELAEQQTALQAAGDSGAFLGEKLRELAEQYPAVAPILMGYAGIADGITSSFDAANQSIQNTLSQLALIPGFGPAGGGATGQSVAQVLAPTVGGGSVNFVTVNTQASDADEVARIIAWTLGGQ